MRLKRVLLVFAALVLLGLVGVVVEIGPRNLIGMARYDTRKEGMLWVQSMTPLLPASSGVSTGDEPHPTSESADKKAAVVFEVIR